MKYIARTDPAWRSEGLTPSFQYAERGRGREGVGRERGREGDRMVEAPLIAPQEARVAANI